MKKIKFLLILMLFIPIFSVKADELICKYKDGNKTAYIKMEGSSGSWRITGGEVTAYGSTHPIGFIKVDGKYVELENYKGTFGYCFNQMGLDHPISAGVGQIIPHECPSGLEYGCFQYVSGTPTSASMESSSDTQTSVSSDKYKDLGKCPGTSCEYIKACGCVPAGLVDLTSRIFNLIKIIAPVLLIIIGGFDLIKAVTAADEKAIQKEQNKLIKKIVAAVIIFMLFTLVQFVAGLVSDDAKDGDIGTCFNYFVNGYNPGECEQE